MCLCVYVSLFSIIEKYYVSQEYTAVLRAAYIIASDAEGELSGRWVVLLFVCGLNGGTDV